MIKSNKLINTYLFTLIIIIISNTSCTDRMTVKSPDGENSITLEIDKNGTLFYSVQSYQTPVIGKSLMGIEISDSTLDFNSNLKLVKVKKRFIDEIYTLPTGKTSTYKNKANEAVFTFKNRYNKLLNVVCRAYNDGVAFRYAIDNDGEITIKEERTRFTIPSNTISWIMDYNPTYENFYEERLLDTIAINKSFSYPALMNIEGKIWLLLTEACVYDQPATHIKKTGLNNNFIVELPQEKYSILSKWESPWRTFILGTNLSTIVESVMVENLNPPSLISDMNWIEPGVAVFPWWGNYMANSYIDTLKMYVDLAAEMDWEWIEFDVALVGSPFRSDTLWRSVNWISDFIAYAKSKGIKVYGWDEMSVLRTKQDREYLFEKYRELGIKGIKIDYIDSDRQEAMIFRKDALEDAANMNLMVSFHGETVPRGQRRTYPNLMTSEAVRGAEYYTFDNVPPPTPKHNCILPFTRNVVGPMDYTPVTFTIRPENPRKSTYAHELALAVIFESGWQVMADRPKSYLNSPAKKILREIVSAWDETHFIEGYPGDYICLSRRKGEKWFIAGINSEGEKLVDIPLTFISSGEFKVEIYEDKQDEKMTNISVREDIVTFGSVLSVKMVENGGFCAFLEKQ
jgi:alpha-glucosidase